MASVKLLPCGSADAIDDEWWSETAGRKRKSAEGLSSQRKRRKKSKVEDVETEMVRLVYMQSMEMILHKQT